MTFLIIKIEYYYIFKCIYVGCGGWGGSGGSLRGGMKNLCWEVNWREGSGENMRDATPASCT